MLDLAVPRRNAVWRRSLFVVGMTTLGACSDGIATRVPSTVSVSSGNSQTVAMNSPATAPLVVTVLDQNGVAMPAVMVTWSIYAGTGSLSAASTATDDDGHASVEFTAGAATGDVAIDAIVTGLDAVTFSLTVAVTPSGN